MIVLETTMVGSNTYEEANVSAIATYNKAAQEGNLPPISTTASPLGTAI